LSEITHGACCHNILREFRIDDYIGLINIIKESLGAINWHMIEAEQRKEYKIIKDKFIWYLQQTNPAVDKTIRNPKELFELLEKLLNEDTSKKIKNISGLGYYLAAEHIGEDFDVWEALFVPKFIAINELLERNICVLTGLRGCGKTMLFKRLSSYYNLMLGGPADLQGSDLFYGFYINARDIAETFPWLPEKEENNANLQVVHNFNLKWALEILIWLREYIKNKKIDLSFLNNYFNNHFPDYFTSERHNSINYLIDMIKSEISKSKLRSKYRTDDWSVTHYDFLEEFVSLIKMKINLIEDKPFYFFVDDYSLPMVKSTIQRILNPIIFRRSANVIFKVSTESVESFVQTGLNEKTLEENDDYRLIDCGMITLNKNLEDCKDILFSIIQKRIERHTDFKNRNLTVEKMLGKTNFNDEERAQIIKGEGDSHSESGNRKYLYQGWKVFCQMWTSDIREMINLFADMINIDKDFRNSDYLIADRIQDKIYKESGQHFIELLEAATNPSEKSLLKDNKRIYAKHLKSIVDVFGQIALFDLRNKTSKNDHTITIKKARRIEIKSIDDDLPEEALDYYKGLIRYGIFIRDFRGKSVKGRIAPRLVLRSRLIPCYRLTFSKRDNITMSWEEFKSFLLTPEDFLKEKIKRSVEQPIKQEELFNFKDGYRDE
jgi:hypothetical protein